jgi:hypothetical protein
MANRAFVRNLKDSSGNVLSGVAKAATFNSEALDPNGFDLIGLVVDINTVTGTSPTLDIKMQMSIDGGTTWLDTYPQGVDTETQWTLAQIQTAKETSAFIRNWFPVSGSSGVDPRVRFVFTIGGTNPSFTLTNIYVVVKDLGF